MLNFKYSSLINAPVKTVWKFHERKDILNILTPPWQPVKIVRREGGLEVGAISEFQIWLGLIPICWVAKHIECQEYVVFTDEQIIGPMVSWLHLHKFDSEEEGKTRLTDEINYQLPGGDLAEFLLGWWVESRLRDMFIYRHLVTKNNCEN
jgi:ligand-binding SRPBCC domain-containing protein